MAQRADRGKRSLPWRCSGPEARGTAERADQPVRYGVRTTLGTRHGDSQDRSDGQDRERGTSEAELGHLAAQEEMKIMAMKLTSEFEVPCPCCNATLVVDSNLRRV